MLIKVELLVLLTDENTTTAYLLDRQNNIILPLIFNDWPNVEEKILEIGSLIKSTNSEAIFMKIDGQGSILSVITPHQIVSKLATSLQVGLLYAQYLNTPIFVGKELLEKDGIPITKQFIEETLQR